MSQAKLHPNNIANLAHKHKTCLTSYEIIVPAANLQKFEEKIVFGRKTPAFDFCFTKHSWGNDIKPIYDSLKTNYERECGDLTKFDDPQYIYFVIASELAPGFKKTENFKYVGLIEVFDDVIQFMWLHPFLRNKGLMTLFFQWYAEEENMLCLQPPVSNSCSAMMKKVQDQIINDKKLFSIQMEFSRRYFRKRVPRADVDNLTDEEVMKVRQAMEIFSAVSDERPEGLDWDKAVEIACKSIKFINENPQLQNELQEWADKNVDAETLHEKMKNFRKYGSTKEI